jgi:hypothetical protein
MGGQEQQLARAAAILGRSGYDHHCRGVPEDLKTFAIPPSPVGDGWAMISGVLYRSLTVDSDACGTPDHVEGPRDLPGERRGRLGGIPEEVLNQLALDRLGSVGAHRSA